MSRVANNPVELPRGVEVKLDGSDLTVKGSKGALQLSLAAGIQVSQDDNVLTINYEGDQFKAMAGTTRALLNNMVVGVSKGFERVLEIEAALLRGAIHLRGADCRQ